MEALLTRCVGLCGVTDPWPRQDTIAAVRAVLFRDNSGDDPTWVDVVDVAGRLRISFTWRRDPRIYAVEYEYPETGDDLWEESALEWGGETAGLLGEDLQTGLVQRAFRVRHGDVTLLGLDRARALMFPSGHHIGEVPSDGSYMAGRGLDVSVAHRLMVDGELVCWLQAYQSTSSEPFSLEGHVAVGYVDRDAAVARLASLQVLQNAHPLTAWNLAHGALHDAAAEGLAAVVTALDHPALPSLGFRPGPDGLLTLRLADFD